MARRKTKSFVREIEKDPRFGSKLVQKLINVLMQRGKKGVAKTIVYGALEALNKKTDGDDEKLVATFEEIVTAIKPQVEVKARRVGGRVYQVPVQVRPKRAQALALRWIVSSAKGRPEKSMLQRLSNELLEASEGRGEAMKKRLNVHKMAEANRAFSHYAW